MKRSVRSGRPMARRMGRAGRGGKARTRASSRQRGVTSQAMERRLRAAERRHFWTGVLIASAFCFLALTHAWTRVRVLERGNLLGAAGGEMSELLREQSRLVMELDTSGSVLQVDQEARTRLGMQRPSPERLIILETLAPAALDPGREEELLDLNARIPSRKGSGTWFSRGSSR